MVILVFSFRSSWWMISLVFSGLIQGFAFLQSLCNACGIKSRKKRQAAAGIRQDDSKMKNNLGLDKRSVKIGREDPENVKNRIKTTDPEEDDNNGSGDKKNVKRVSRFLDFGFKVPAMKRSSVEKKRLWRKLGEEERAAVLLMTLSCGWVLCFFFVPSRWEI